MSTINEFYLVSSPMVSFWENIKNFNPQFQGCKTLEGTFDGISYDINAECVKQTFFFQGRIGSVIFVIHGKRDQKYIMYFGKTIAEVFNKSADNKSIPDIIADCNSHSDIKEMFDYLFVSEKLEMTSASILNNLPSEVSDSHKLIATHRMLFAKACVRLWATKNISYLDARKLGDLGVMVNDIELNTIKSEKDPEIFHNTLKLKLGEVVISISNQFPNLITIQVTEDNQVMHETQLKIERPVSLLIENKYIQEDMFRAINFYFEHCER